MLIGHKKQWEFLKRKFELDQLSHAYLFTGEDGIGKKTFAKEFAESVNCKFPDLMIVEVGQEKDLPAQAGISIAKIREVQSFLAYKSYNGGYKIVIVDGAELMNQEAQSCFLKTLEEPKGKTLMFLITSKPEMILETIFSRCQQIKFFKPNGLPENKEKVEKEKEILQSLTAVLNSDFAEKFKYVKALDFEKQSAKEILEVMQKYIRHLLMIRVGNDKGSDEDLKFIKYSVDDLKRILNLIEDINKKLIFTNASPKLALEILLMET